MSADLFVIRDADASARSRQSSLLIASIVVHATALAAAVVAAILIPDVLPTPHTAFAWGAGPQIVKLPPTPPPAPIRRPKPLTAPSDASVTAIPVVAPTGISEERAVVPPDAGLLEHGLVEGALNGAPMTAAPPPPPPPLPQVVSRKPVRLHAGIEAPRKVKDSVPAYPALARSTGAQGVVIIEAIVDINGDVVSAKILRSVPLLDQVAIDAVRQWKYTPARLNGEPVPVVITVTVNFTLAGR
jgi:protein TonB